MTANDHNTSIFKNAHLRDFQDIEKKKGSQKRKADDANEDLELIHNKDIEDEENKEMPPAVLAPTTIIVSLLNPSMSS